MLLPNTLPALLRMGGNGGTGRRASLGSWWGACDKENTPCEFDPRLPHQNCMLIFTLAVSIVKYAIYDVRGLGTSVTTS